VHFALPARGAADVRELQALLRTKAEEWQALLALVR